VRFIARMNRDYLTATVADRGAPESAEGGTG
jgi:hypothetical protein